MVNPYSKIRPISKTNSLATFGLQITFTASELQSIAISAMQLYNPVAYDKLLDTFEADLSELWGLITHELTLRATTRSIERCLAYERKNKELQPDQLKRLDRILDRLMSEPLPVAPVKPARELKPAF